MRSILSGQSRNKGVTLITLIVAITIFGVLVSVFSYVTIAKHGSEALYVQSTQAYAIAQAGIEYSIRYAAERGYGDFPITESLGNGSFTVDHETDPNRLISTGTVGLSERKITLRFSNIMYVADITMKGKVKGRDKEAEATVLVHDINGLPVERVTVFGRWSGATSDEDIKNTDRNGKAKIKSDKVKGSTDPITFTFTVEDLSLTGWTYDSTQNVETSDSITL